MVAAAIGLSPFESVNEMKKCSGCKRELELSKFGGDKSRRDGLNRFCKECAKNKGKDYRKSNRERILEINKIWKDNNKERSIEYSKKYYQKNVERTKEYFKNRYRTDSNYKTLHLLRCRIYYALKRVDKSVSTKKLLGCTVDKFKLHIESQFTEGMHWENQGEWHLDHIVPCSYFDLSIKENQFICFNYKNLQPLWKDENMEKKATLPDNHLQIIEDIKQNLYL